MAGENDQCKWVGIRPTNPAENIPVTESTPLTSILVSPLAAGTEFKTLTEKRSPAISDVQAISGIVSQYETDDVAGGRFDITFGAVPAGEIWKITSITAYASILWGTTEIRLMNGAEVHIIATPNPVGFCAVWGGELYMEEDEYLLLENRAATNGATYHVSVRGYKIDLY